MSTFAVLVAAEFFCTLNLLLKWYPEKLRPALAINDAFDEMLLLEAVFVFFVCVWAVDAFFAPAERADNVWLLQVVHGPVCAALFSAYAYDFVSGAKRKNKIQ